MQLRTFDYAQFRRPSTLPALFGDADMAHVTIHANASVLYQCNVWLARGLMAASCTARWGRLTSFGLAFTIGVYALSAAAETTTVTTYTYSGSPIGLSASVSFGNLPPNYTGIFGEGETIPGTTITSYSVSAPGLTANSAKTTCPGEGDQEFDFQFNFTNGSASAFFGVSCQPGDSGGFEWISDPGAEEVFINDEANPEIFYGSSSSGIWTLTSYQTGTTPPLQITTTGLPAAISGQQYGPAPITATGGSGSGYNWTITPASPAPGFSPSAEGSCGNSCTDVFLSSTGTPPAAAGSYNFTAQVTDSVGNLSVQPLTVVVNMTAPTCADILMGAMPPPVLGWPYSTTGEPTTVSATFTPNQGLTLQQAEQTCNVTSFNWIQQITIPAPSPGYAINLSNGIRGIPINISGNSFDPPPNGGWAYEYYQGGDFKGKGDFAYPFYCDYPEDDNLGGRCSETVNTLEYLDAPSDFCLPNPDGIPSNILTTDNKGNGIVGPYGLVVTAQSLCGGSATGVPPANAVVYVFFQLVGTTVLPANAVGTICLQAGTCKSFAGYGDAYGYKSTFNGTAGGVVALAEGPPVDPGSGSGGITLLQLPTVVPPNEVTTTASGLAYSRVSQTFNGTVTLTNISNSAISGPLQILFTGMPSNVTLMNATGSFAGIPYLTAPAAAGLARGQSVTVGTQFKNPSNATINFAPAIYSGSIN